MPEIQVKDSWIKGSDHTYYYKLAVAPGASAAELLSAPVQLATEDGCYQVLEVFAEAIQSLPVKAVTESWKVTLDANGDIISVAD